MTGVEEDTKFSGPAFLSGLITLTEDDVKELDMARSLLGLSGLITLAVEDDVNELDIARSLLGLSGLTITRSADAVSPGLETSMLSVLTLEAVETLGDVMPDLLNVLL
nr:hypothetical protein BaRGS_030639 [Batillaria attramentaria]